MKRPESPLSGGPRLPWWRVPMVWLVLAGPAIVVVAAIATAFIAARGADPIVSAGSQESFADTPAMQGRNNAATAAPSK
jgi:hypothetical protein